MSTRMPTFSLSMVCPLVFLGCATTLKGAATVTPPKVEPAVTKSRALTDAAKALVGTWNCSGSVVGPEGPSPSKVRLSVRLALDNAWLESDFEVASGKYPYKFNSQRTFEASSGTWVNLIVDNLGGHTVSRSTDGVTWTGTSSTPMGAMKIRDTETVFASDKLTMLGQYSLDDGVNWSTGYELSCER